MKFAFKSLVVASSLIAAGLSSAGAVTISTSGSVTSGDWSLSGLTGTGTLSFSTTLIGALNAGGVQVSQVDPAVVTSTKRTNGKYSAISAAAPISSLTGTQTGSVFAANSVSTLGGALQTAEADDFTTTGGSLAITNLRVDLDAKKVYATLVGANGVGTVNNLYLWDIATVTGATSGTLLEGVNTYTNELTGLKINANAFSLFSQALGLTQAGNDALATVTDFGKISSTLSFNATKVATPAVPEPSTYALMGVGLLGIAAAARRRAK
ncbi:MAG: hypothetical protein A2711_16745 [Burkholderiales bacterium RIFCSPHIGHO2_01_FULL_63_240]|jgi:hypothetical protein|nr:MAG: hypothetical protein A2711_16745 [Burkholderiales bacterium RIFCSPHIGHO2_01_FULL_63_240]